MVIHQTEDDSAETLYIGSHSVVIRPMCIYMGS
jgi:hypothetical protein